MGESVLVLGESGAGKSTSLRNLNHETTYLISVIGKRLPFPGFSKKYKQTDGENKGNLFISDNYMQILKCIEYVKTLGHIETLIIDDFRS